MAYSSAIREKAMTVINERHFAAIDRAQRIKDAMYTEYPRLGELDGKIASNGILLARRSLGNDSEEIERAKAMLDESLREKQEFIKENGINADAMEPNYVCRLCDDTGYLSNGELCSCAEALMKELLIESTVIPEGSFDDFKLTYYSDEVDPEHGTSSRRTMSRNLKICVDFAKSFPQHGRNLFLMGDAGLGKTHLAASIAKVVTGRGYRTIYCSTASILKKIENEYYSSRRFDTLDELKSCELLILDDLGAEYVNAFAVTTLYDIIDTRLTRGFSTVYTSNITGIPLLESRYGEKISSRLTGCCDLLPFFGDDIRQI